MSEETANLNLPFILSSQAQKHITHNETLTRLDALVHLAITASATTPPASPAEGARYFVSAGASGDWTGFSLLIAAWQDGAWTYLTPRIGWLAWFIDEAKLKVWRGSSWTILASA